ncbi:DUF6634 family protein [Pseudogemmobacter bohemicus]|uniref:DUF6634 family protein n=1 Tax=Pseudogemmobacter bohemicus TaxID=2250708 RepID=UPI000DD48F78|nr:DUF6634 family protein [Pseudogemmobacter bohemicus]
MSANDKYGEHSKAAQAVLDGTAIDPTEGELSEAPFLNRWEVVRDAFGYTILYGHVAGHPTLEGPAIRTSPLLRLNVSAGWARTCSRFYRLGAPLGQAGSVARNAFLVAAPAKRYHGMTSDEVGSGIQRNRELILKSPQHFRWR